MARKPYPCSQCKKSFHTRAGRDEHFRNRHGGRLITPTRSSQLTYKKFVVGGSDE